MILVTGANGLNGSELLRRLSAGGIAARALVRNRARAATLAGLPGIEVVEGDMLAPDTLAAALAGVERVMLISSSAPSMVEVQSALIDAAKEAGVSHVVKLSGIIPGLDSPFRFARMHAEIERHLEASGLAFTHLRAGEFMSSYLRQLPSIIGKGALLLPMESARIASVDVGDIAAVAVLALTGSGHAGKVYSLTGPQALTMTEVAEKLTKVTGRPIRYISVAPEDARRAQLAAGLPPYLVDGLAELFALRRAGGEATVYPDVANLLGRPATSFEAFAERHAALFRGDAVPPAP